MSNENEVTIDEIVVEAAALSAAVYDMERRGIAKDAKLRVSTLDELVEAERARMRAERREERRARANGHARAPLPFDQKLDLDEFPFVSDEAPISHLDNLAVLLERYGFETFYDANAKKGVWLHPDVANDTDNADGLLFSQVTSLAALNNVPTGNLDVHLTANYERQQRAPVAEYLGALQWDGKPRFDLFAQALASNDDVTTVAAAMRVFLLQACAAADGAKRGIAKRIELGKRNVGEPAYEDVLVLHSPQGRGKTKRFLNLVPRALRPYTREGVTLDLRNKDSIITAVSGWLVELGEIDATFKKSDIVALKSFLSMLSDRIRLPYARAASALRRRAAFFGTVNDPEFLRDVTGNRRFLCVTTGYIDPTLDAAIIDQVWAEAWARYTGGERWWPTDDEERFFEVAAEARRERSPWEETLGEFYDFEAGCAENGERHTATSIYSDVRSLSASMPSQADVRAIAVALRKLWAAAPNVVRRDDGSILVPIGEESIGVRRRKASKEGAGLARAYSDDGKQLGWLLPPRRISNQMRKVAGQG